MRICCLFIEIVETSFEIFIIRSIILFHLIFQPDLNTPKSRVNEYQGFLGTGKMTGLVRRVGCVRVEGLWGVPFFFDGGTITCLRGTVREDYFCDRSCSK